MHTLQIKKTCLFSRDKGEDKGTMDLAEYYQLQLGVERIR